MFVRLSCVTVATAMAIACSSPAPAVSASASASASAPMPAMPGNHPMTQDELIKLALSNGPADITAHAAVVDMDEKMNMKELRPGTNGWTCMVRPEGMCADQEWMALLDAYARQAEPHVKTIGVAYMPNGDHGASNIDPYAQKETPDNHWVVSPAHIMIITPDTKQLDALPTDWHNGGPWVMWKGTKYAHVMVPTTAMSAAMNMEHTGK